MQRMLSFSIGPLALPVAPFLLLGATAVAAWTARRWVSRDDAARAEAQVWLALGIGLVAARSFHVALHAELFARQPLRMFDLRDGGWEAGAGLAAAMLWLLVQWQRRPQWRRALLGAGLAGLAVWALFSVVVFRALGVGEPAAVLPPIAVHEFPGGRATTLDQVHDGRPLVVNLWASWCGPCRAEMPLLAEAQRRDTGVRFLFVNQGEAAAAVQAYLQREGLALQDVWLDPTSALGPAVGSTGLPTTLFLDAEGRRVDAHFGVLSDVSLAVRLKALQRP
jgi:thiol-disulfide isomerase/thioredoxin